MEQEDRQQLGEPGSEAGLEGSLSERATVDGPVAVWMPS